jgi:uncharacterized protein
MKARTVKFVLLLKSNKKGTMKAIRPIFQNLIPYNWAFGLIFIILLGIPRFILVLSANVTKNYGSVSIIFIVMWFIPFILLNKVGRTFIGIKKPKNLKWLIYSVALGGIASFIVYLCASWLFGSTINNSLVYIAKSYSASGVVFTLESRKMYFILYAFAGMIFSPIGEELFYRGLIHGSFVSRFGERNASRFDSLAFAFTHLAHFGIVYVAGGWAFLLLPSLVWVISMYAVSRLFFFCKQKTGSLLGAILSHAAYNVMMMYVIFYKILL